MATIVYTNRMKQARKRIIKFRMNDSEYKKLWKHVQKNGTNNSEYIRDLVLADIKLNSPEL